MLRFLVTAMACLLLGQTTDALLLGNPLPSTVAVSANARVASSAAMMAKKPAAKSKLITILLEADVEGEVAHRGLEPRLLLVVLDAERLRLRLRLRPL